MHRRPLPGCLTVAYRGRLPVSAFGDREIRAKEFAKWRDCHSAFRRGERRRIVDRYKAQLAAGDPVPPIWLDVDDKYGCVYVGDGHHRAVALIESGAADFDFHWRLTFKFGLFSQPPLENGPFPYSLLGL